MSRDKTDIGQCMIICSPSFCNSCHKIRFFALALPRFILRGGTFRIKVHRSEGITLNLSRFSDVSLQY